MTDEVRIRLDRDVHRRLRQHARDTGTTVPHLLAALVEGAAVLLPAYNPALNPTRLSRIAEWLDRGVQPETMAEVLQVPLAEVIASIRRLEQLDRELNTPT